MALQILSYILLKCQSFVRLLRFCSGVVVCAITNAFMPVDRETVMEQSDSALLKKGSFSQIVWTASFKWCLSLIVVQYYKNSVIIWQLYHFCCGVIVFAISNNINIYEVWLLLIVTNFHTTADENAPGQSWSRETECTTNWRKYVVHFINNTFCCNLSNDGEGERHSSGLPRINADNPVTNGARVMFCRYIR